MSEHVYLICSSPTEPQANQPGYRKTCSDACLFELRRRISSRLRPAKTAGEQAFHQLARESRASGRPVSAS